MTYKYIMKSGEGEGKKASRSLESVQNDLNNMLLNNIVHFKIQKKIEKQQDLDKFFGTLKDFSKATKTLTSPTISNFSTFNVLMRDNSNINYERLYNKII